MFGEFMPDIAAAISVPMNPPKGPRRAKDPENVMCSIDLGQGTLKTPSTSRGSGADESPWQGRTSFSVEYRGTACSPLIKKLVSIS